MNKYRGHVVATTACMGGELSTLAYDMSMAEDKGDKEIVQICYDKIVDFTFSQFEIQKIDYSNYVVKSREEIFV